MEVPALRDSLSLDTNLCVCDITTIKRQTKLVHVPGSTSCHPGQGQFLVLITNVLQFRAILPLVCAEKRPVTCFHTSPVTTQTSAITVNPRGLEVRPPPAQRFQKLRFSNRAREQILDPSWFFQQ